MKPAAAALALHLALLAPSIALAAPTCLDARGETVRCGTAGAMPVGWAPAPDVAQARLDARHDALSPRMAIGLVCVVGGLLALFALMPDFQGRWDREEGEEGDGRT